MQCPNCKLPKQAQIARVLQLTLAIVPNENPCTTSLQVTECMYCNHLFLNFRQASEVISRVEILLNAFNKETNDKANSIWAKNQQDSHSR